MRSWIRSMLMFVVCALGSVGAGVFAAQASDQAVVGVWQGALDLGAMKLRIVFDIRAAQDGTLTGTLDSPDQRAFGIRLDEVRFNGPEVAIEVRSIGGSFSGNLSPDGKKIDGTWSQAGRQFELDLERGEKIAPARRAQEPVPPLPYDVEEVSYENEKHGVRIAGTLTLPRTPAPHPAVLLITGSGPQDRDETLMGHKPFLVLADNLTRRGFAVLRVDDRGVGGSTGNAMESTVEDYAEDVLSGIGFLRRRSDIDASRIGLIGHSEGGLVGSIAATRSRDIGFLVLIAAPGVRISELLGQQLREISVKSGLSSNAIALQEDLQKRVFEVVRKTPDREPALAQLDTLWREARSAAETLELTDTDRAFFRNSEGLAQANLRTMVTPWFRHLLDQDPAAALRGVQCPVLAILGELDVQVPPERNREAIESALEIAQNRDVTVRVLNGLNHLMQTARTGLPAEYAMIEETFAPAALELIGDWLVARAGARRHAG